MMKIYLSLILYEQYFLSLGWFGLILNQPSLNQERKSPNVHLKIHKVTESKDLQRDSSDNTFLLIFQGNLNTSYFSMRATFNDYYVAIQ